jgi:hypothetical protein
MSMVAALNTAYPTIDYTAQNFLAFGTVTISGNYGTASSNGDTLDLSTLGVPTDYAPIFVVLFESATPGTSQSGWDYVFNRGATIKNGSVQVFGTGTSGQAFTQYTQGSAYSSATPAIPATIYFLAVFVKY